MRKISTIFLALSIVVFSTVVYLKFFNGNKITNVEIKNPLIDIGKVTIGKKIELEYEIKNIGKSNLEIIDVKADCYCTVPEWTKTPIEIGGIGKIKVVYKNDISGYFQQNIRVYANTNHSPLVLTLQGEATEIKE